MGRGRAPCCDKSRVISGPWSPAEDRKLITFIKKYGHDNWRSLPKQAGLLRCGKSCRLRWVNYLNPKVKRGNFTPEEENTIIQMQQSIGNKWSLIASHLPGRTDNEIKIVWNTCLKKRLAKKAVEDVIKETSAITSSSSSCATVDTKRKKSENESQIKMLAREENKMKTDKTGTKMSFASIHQKGSQMTEVIDCESFNTFDPIYQQSAKSLGSMCSNHYDQTAMWEDISLLESMLNEDDDPKLLQAPTHNGSIENNSSCELNMEFDFDFWSLLDNDVIPAPAKPEQNKADNVHNVEAPPISKQGKITLYEYADENDISRMLKYLEKEAGLTQQSVKVFEKQNQNQKDDFNNSFTAAANGPRVDGIPNMNFPVWPQSPISFFSVRNALRPADPYS